ncbi:MAG: hypothetical protein QOD66_383 [Solirubrobacteraceae bacterium]|jgi:hypothetical protein|nr:hypothetical protein [Solirubrobacteraceae bacterium]
MPTLKRAPCAVIALVAVALSAAGCGLSVHSADLFILKRSGQGHALTLLVSDGGTIRCDGARPKPISDAMLLQARDLADNLAKDAKAKLSLPPGPHSIYTYRVKLQDGTISFADTSASVHHELAAAELFAAQAAQGVCGPA